MPDTAATAALLRRHLQPVVAAAGLDLEDLVVRQVGRRRQLRLLVDRDGGVTLEECAELSRHVAEELDDSDVLGEASYVLEVSSPGVSRPLTTAAHWRRARGRLVTATLRAGGQLTGRVLTASEEAVELSVDGSHRRLPYADVAKAVVQVELNRPDEPDLTEEG